MNKNGIYEMADGVYQIRYYYLGTADVYMYLVIGKEKALLIDTGYTGNIDNRTPSDTLPHTPEEHLEPNGRIAHQIVCIMGIPRN